MIWCFGRKIGEQAEQKALRWLKKRGLKLEAKNFRCPWGEIDLIMWDGEVLVFIEVRYRRSNHYGSAAASITPQKQRKIRRTAQYYLQKNKLNPACRFDCIAVQGQDIQWIKQAL